MKRTRLLHKTFSIPAALSVLCLLFLTASCRNDTGTVLLEEGNMAPVISLKDTGGNSWSLSAQRGSVVLINFWATWCYTCKEEMPSLNALLLKTMNEPDLRIVTVLYRDDPKAALKYMQENGFGLPVLTDPDMSAATSYGITGVPETYVVDKRGVLRKKIIGPTRFDSPEALAYIKGLLSEQP